MVWFWITVVLSLAGVAFWTWQAWKRRPIVIMVAPAPPAYEMIAPLLTAIVDPLPDGVIVLDTNRHIVFANTAAAAILDRASQDLVDQSAIAVLRDYYADAMIGRVLTMGEPEALVLEGNGSHRRTQLTCHPITVPFPGVMLVLQDLTRLANAERARRDLVANVSHELGTPLASIRLLVETLATHPPPAIAQRMLGQIEDETQAMTQLVGELRELTQIESGRLALHLMPTDVLVVIERAVERLQQQAARRHLELRIDGPATLPLVLIDAERIGQVLLNLLSNALKFTPAGGTITITASPWCGGEARFAPPWSTADRAWLCVMVVDTGIGIPSQELDRIFERFYKVDRARTRNSGGTGLGLAIAKHVVERHGGRIWVESQEGRGSTFRFLLPVA